MHRAGGCGQHLAGSSGRCRGGGRGRCRASGRAPRAGRPGGRRRRRRRAGRARTSGSGSARSATTWRGAEAIGGGRPAVDARRPRTPAAVRRATNAEPMNPLAPVTTITAAARYGRAAGAVKLAYQRRFGRKDEGTLRSATTSAGRRSGQLRRWEMDERTTRSCWAVASRIGSRVVRRACRATGRPVERADHVGGLAGSFDVAGVRVDNGSHRFHERTEPELLADLQGLLGDELQHRPRHGRIRLCERWVAFPLRPADLVTAVPPAFAARAARDLAAGPVRMRRGADSFAAACPGRPRADRRRRVLRAVRPQAVRCRSG